MSLSIQVLGQAGRDNAVLVRIDTGQAVGRLLFDCGEGCLASLGLAEVRAIDHLFFSHLHMDHVGGFDTFFRCNFDRTDSANHVWGPARTAEVMHHRFRGFLWNLIEGRSAAWHVHDLLPGKVESRRFELAEAFAEGHGAGERGWDRIACDGKDFSVESYLMDHGTPSAAYVVREAERVNVDTAKLAAGGLKPGPWLKRLRGPRAAEGEAILIDGAPRPLAPLQDDLLVVTPGDSTAYLTDFRMDEEAIDRLAGPLAGCSAVVCECQYRHADRELAERNRHTTTVEAATLAARAGVGRLVLFHLSDRYTPDVWREMLAEARAVFPAAEFPGHWGLSG